jgi:hypothetical protein
LHGPVSAEAAEEAADSLDLVIGLDAIAKKLLQL